MEETLRKYIDNQIADNYITISYQIGNSFLGETFFEITGEGNYLLWSTVTKGRKKIELSGKLDKKEVVELANLIIKNKIREVKHINQHPADDDAESVIAVKEGDKAFKSVLWNSEVGQVKPFEEVVKQIILLINRISKGKILESGY